MHSTYFSLGKNTFLKARAELLFKKAPRDNNKKKVKELCCHLVDKGSRIGLLFKLQF